MYVLNKRTKKCTIIFQSLKESQLKVQMEGEQREEQGVMEEKLEKPHLRVTLPHLMSTWRQWSEP